MKHPDVGLYQFNADPIVWIRGGLLLLFIAVSAGLSGQEKGTEGLVPEVQGSAGGTTRAVVVGISDYQHPDIPDLRFAHRDAEIFTQYLHSKSAGSLPYEHIRLLTDSRATSARFESELSWLLDESQPGDKAIIYFSGHGDVEQKYGNSGFLLCHDASPKLYGSTGAFGIGYLKSLVQSFKEKRVRIILITDACRAGKLAGSPIEGPNLTAAAMREQFANEIILMACQPNEMSMESPNLGKGRGVFSYYLMRGLLGNADEDDDKIIKLAELHRYLTYHVPKEVSPLYQNPIVSGNAEIPLAVIDTSDMLAFEDGDVTSPAILAYYSEKSYEDAYSLRLDSSRKELVHSFMELVSNKMFLEPLEHCADKYYELIQLDSFIQDDFKRYIRRFYAVALQDDIQQALLTILDGNLTSGPETRIMIEKYKNYPQQIARSAEILGKHHIMYNNLKAREKWLEGFLIYGHNANSTVSEIGNKAISKFHESIKLEPNSPVVHYHLALTYLNIKQMPDSACLHVKLANTKAMNWTLPNTHIAALLSKKPYYDFIRATSLLEEAMSMDSTSVLVWRGLGTLHYYQKDYQQAESYFRRALKQDSTNGLTWSNLAAVISSPARYREAEEILLEGIKKCPETGNLRYVYGCILANTRRTVSAIRLFNEAKKINPNYKPSRDSLVEMYIRTDQLDLAIEELYELIRMNTNDHTAYFRLAMIYLDKKDFNQVQSCLTSYFMSLQSNQQDTAIDPRIKHFFQYPELKPILDHHLQNKPQNE